jgi:sn-glycerol 3-phosphate transport system ATP-binding protein
MNLMNVDGAIIGVRPENVRIDSGGRAARVESVEYLGADSLVAVRIDNQPLLVRVPGHSRARLGEQVHIVWDQQHEHHFDARTGERKP